MEKLYNFFDQLFQFHFIINSLEDKHTHTYTDFMDKSKSNEIQYSKTQQSEKENKKCSDQKTMYLDEYSIIPTHIHTHRMVNSPHEDTKNRIT